MLDRREWIKAALSTGATLMTMGLVGCGKESQNGEESRFGLMSSRGEVVLYDTFMMALYMDGGLGPKTGTFKVDYVLANQPVTLKFWHGHGGKDHYFTLTPEIFAEVKKLKKVYVTTTVVDSHTHKLFIDVSDARWRVPGALPVPVPVL